MTFGSLLLLAGGLACLLLGAEGLIRGAARLALLLGIPPLVVGLTVVAVGTSAPEAVVTVGAVLDGRADMAVGNVVGSNILNILLILGMSAVIVPLTVSSPLIRLDVPAMVVLSILVYLLALGGGIGPVAGVGLLAAAVGYTWFRLHRARRGKVEGPRVKVHRERHLKEAGSGGGVLRNLVLVAAGFLLLALGADWLVTGAVEIAQVLGVSELVIGLTLVAAGTSLPEVAASLLAAFRGERDLAVGNVVGSNLYNLTLVLGLGAVAAPGDLPVAPGVLGFDLPLMVIVAVACLPIFFTGSRIDRWEGGLFLGYYAAYVGCLFLKAVDHEAVGLLSGIMLLFVVPLTVVTLGVIVIREIRGRARSRHAG